MKSETERLRWQLCQLKKGYRKIKHGQNHLLYLEKIKQVEDELERKNKTNEDETDKQIPKELRELWKLATEAYICKHGGAFPVRTSITKEQVEEWPFLEDYQDKECCDCDELEEENELENDEKDDEIEQKPIEKPIKNSAKIREGLNRGRKLHRQ